MSLRADDVVRMLDLKRHPEGGWYRETWRGEAADGERAPGTAIYYLLDFADRSHWHRIDAAEIWHYYAGAPLRLSLSSDGRNSRHQLLGPDLAQGHAPQIIIPPHVWQAAESLGPWTLVGCTVSPGFEFDRFELAPADWAPGQD